MRPARPLIASCDILEGGEAYEIPLKEGTLLEVQKPPTPLGLH